MKISDLAKINISDLQRIDIQEVKFFLMQRLDISVCLILGGLSVAGAIFIVSQGNISASSMNQQVRIKKDLLTVANEQKDLIKKIDEFKQKFPKNINSDQLIDQLSNLAVDHGVQINSLSPVKEDTDTFKKTVSLEIAVSSSDYDKLILFSKDIESLPYSIRIDTWSGSMESPLKPTQRNRNTYIDPLQKQKEKEDIKATIKISLVQLIQ